MQRALRLAILVIGASGIIAQIILIRELMVSFYGNELSIGLVIGNWLILEALGSFFAGKIRTKEKSEQVTSLQSKVSELKVGLFSTLVIIFSIALPIMIYIARVVKNIIGAAPGETLSIPTMFLSSFLILIPLSVSHGALFTLSCNLFSISTKSEKAVGKVYVLETVGTIVGGIILPYLLIPYFSSFSIAFGLGLLNFFALFILIRTLEHKSWIIPTCALMIFFAILLLGKLPKKIQDLSIVHQWRGHNIVYYRNSIYGNIAVLKQQEQYTFCEDGIPVINTPVPDIAFAEDFVHFPLLSHPDPKRVLVISGGAGGIITEILKHPVSEVDYVELDPLLLEAVAKFPTPITTEELNDSRVKLIRQDAKQYLIQHVLKYDLILINFLAPATLQMNRFFTKEFFTLAKKRLNDQGIMVSISFGSLSYLSEELKRIIISNWLTLKSAFPYVKIIPGDFNLFLASSSPDITEINPQILSERLIQRKIKTRLITPDYLSDRLSDYRSDWFWKSLEQTTTYSSTIWGKNKKKVAINSDLAPHGVFYNLIYWSALSSLGLRRFFNILQSITVFHFALIFILLLLIGVVLLYWRAKLGELQKLLPITIPFAIFSTGFVGMALNLVVVLAFQSAYGYVYRQISILVTAFIVGTALGGFVITQYAEKVKKGVLFFLLFESLLILMSLITPLFLFKLRGMAELVFPILSVLIGCLVGMEFPLANKIYSGHREVQVAESVGLLYGSDLGGGFLGAILVSIVLIPVLGISATCIIALMFKIISILLILLSQFIKSKPNL
jgi:spermidine synthase